MSTVPLPESFLILSRLQSGTEEVVRLDEAIAYGAACAAAERERCAKACEDIVDSAWALWRVTADPTEQGRSIGAEHCADAIRNMEPT